MSLQTKTFPSPPPAKATPGSDAEKRAYSSHLPLRSLLVPHIQYLGLETLDSSVVESAGVWQLGLGDTGPLYPPRSCSGYSG